MRTAPLIIVPHSNKSDYLDRYAEPDKGWTDRDEPRWPVPYWDIDTGMASLLMLLTAVDEGLGACFFGIPPERIDGVPGRVRCAGGIHARSGRSASATVRRRPPVAVAATGPQPVDEVVHRGQWSSCIRAARRLARSSVGWRVGR